MDPCMIFLPQNFPSEERKLDIKYSWSGPFLAKQLLSCSIPLFSIVDHYCGPVSSTKLHPPQSVLIPRIHSREYIHFLSIFELWNKCSKAFVWGWITMLQDMCESRADSNVSLPFSLCFLGRLNNSHLRWEVFRRPKLSKVKQKQTAGCSWSIYILWYQYILYITYYSPLFLCFPYIFNGLYRMIIGYSLALLRPLHTFHLL